MSEVPLYKAARVPCCCRANMAHIRQSGPDYGLGFQVKVLNKVSPLRSDTVVHVNIPMSRLII